MSASSLPTRANADVIDAAYQQWLDNPDSVDPTWRAFFQGFELGTSGQAATPTSAPTGIPDAAKQAQVHRLINAFRAHGHLEARLDPLATEPPAWQNQLSLSRFGLTKEDLDLTFNTGTYKGGIEMKLLDIVETLKKTYCAHIGAEFLYVQDLEARDWLRDQMENCDNRANFDVDTKKRILGRVLRGELFEKFLHKKFTGQKRFSLEGGETLIAALDTIIQACPGEGVKEIVLGMAHRGRLSVLANILRKPFALLFGQFNENYVPDTVGGDGDVKYHLGFEAVLATKTPGHSVEVRLAANPSHLEIVGPVVQGKARARQRIRGTEDRVQVCPLLIHGDAAFAGQGVVAEMLNFSQLPGYLTAGTVHFVINNQIGFTTSPADARSTTYCTDVAKMIEAPVIHVNGDDPEAVCYVTKLAFEFRNKFKRDIVVDMYCYRKHGHNESDEPAFTQPVLYQKINAHPAISEIYSEKLLGEKSLSEADIQQLHDDFSDSMEAAFEKAKADGEAREKANGDTCDFKGSNAVFQPGYSHVPTPTGVSMETLTRVAQGLTVEPTDFQLNPKIRRFLANRRSAFEAGEGIDWAFGEALAFGTLLIENTPVRLSGQDCRRGTFSQRHAVIYDANIRERYVPLLNLSDTQAKFCVYNSLLSEAAVLGFDYGYSLDFPDMLCLWEAQFGDFANGAQVIIDQFIASSESKWQRVSGIVLLLPHGYEGQGPEHSSARLERFLQLCAEDNIQVANITTPANYYHALRRQVRRDFRKPLIIMSPKSLLRHPKAVSKVADFNGDTAFQEIIEDAAPNGKKPKRVILCSGKVYYDLVNYREEHKHTQTAIVRVEQLYPLHADRLAELNKAYGPAAKLIWCQEESENMGAWRFIAPQLETIFGRKAIYAGRDAAASPAVGALALHKLELAAFLDEAFSL